MTTSTHTSRRLGTTLALVAGLGIGYVDRSATEVQGSLLWLMAAAFLVSLLTSAPGFLVACAVALGVPLMALASGHAHWDALVALLPALAAAYSGKVLAAIVRSTSASLDVGARTTAPDASLPWYLRRAAPPVLLGGALLGCAVVGAMPVYAALTARGQPFAWWLTSIWQVISFVAWAVACAPILAHWRRTRGGRARGIAVRDVAVHAALATTIATLHAIVLPLLTRALFVPLGSASIGSAMQWAFATYLPLDALTYCLIIGLGHASDSERHARDAAVREALVRGELNTVRLNSLRAQLRPHFLFNALNAATVLTRQGDATSSANVLTSLAELLRYVLQGADADAGPTHQGEFVTLADEAAFVETYLAVERQRFPDRLTTTIDIPPDVACAVIPHLLLQPLVENAIRHGIGARLAAGTVLVRARRELDVVIITVEDDGPGPATSATATRGIGLANSRARLTTLYGDDARLSITGRPAGGTEARVELPYRE